LNICYFCNCRPQQCFEIAVNLYPDLAGALDYYY
jgi:hypothetical protein